MRKPNPLHNRILDLWAEDYSASEIVAMTGASSRAMVNAAVYEWRQLGDRRAAKRVRPPCPNPVTREYVLSIFAYSADDGTLRWLKTSCSGRRGELAGYEHEGYRRVELGGRVYFKHHLIWLVETGEMHDGMLDHRDTDTGNNRFSNLRPTTQSQNSANRGVPANNTTGFKGVKLLHGVGPDGCQYEAWITKNYKRIYLGRFRTAAEGGAAYERAAIIHFGEFARAA